MSKYSNKQNRGMDSENPYDDIACSVSEFQSIPIDVSLDEKVGISEDTRKSIFRWGGQFPPELAAFIIAKHAVRGSVIVDPFCGSGTVLFESVRLGLTCFGSDINPAAVGLSKTAEFSNIPNKSRESLLENAYNIFQKALNSGISPESNSKLTHFDYENIKKSIANISPDSEVFNIIFNVLMRLSISKEKGTVPGLVNAFNIHKKIINSLPYSKNKCDVKISDAGSLPLKPKSADLVLTSPPYPGVFDYYKNYKWVMHFLGWNISEIARKEIGHGRGSGNIKSWLIKYSYDMHNALCEIHRILKNSGRLILVVDSNTDIGKSKFDTSALLYLISTLNCGFKLVERQQRHFTGRNGNIITEDILHLLPINTNTNLNDQRIRKFVEYLYAETNKNAK